MLEFILCFGLDQTAFKAEIVLYEKEGLLLLLLKHDTVVQGALLERLRGPLEEAIKEQRGVCEAYLYEVGSRAGELVLRLSTPYAVVPILLRPADLEPRNVFVLVKNALARSDA